MKSFVKNLSGWGLGSLLLFSCDPKIDTPTPSVEGKIDVSNYIAIGNSLTAGFASNGLFLEGQKVAYPVLMAEQFKLAGGGEFNAPLFSPSESDGTGYLLLTGFLNASTPILTSVPRDPDAVAGKSPSAYHPSLNPDSIVLKTYSGPKIHNWGVPGIRVADLNTPGYGFPNAYFGRLLADAEKTSATYQAKILGQNPSFYSCWLGNNDVLGYTTAGGYVDLGRVTDYNLFTSNFTGLLSGLDALASKPKGVLANIPDITSIPYFTSVTPSVKTSLSLSGVPAFFEFKFDSVFQNTIIPALISPTGTILDTNKVLPSLVSDLGSLNAVSGSIEGNVFLTLTFSPYASQLGKPRGQAWRDIIRTLIKSFVLPPPFDQVPKDQLEALAWAKSGLDTLQPFGFSKKNPIPDVFVLNRTETARARNAVAYFNEVIKNQAEARGLAWVDANSFLRKITSGSYYDAISTNSAFLSGGVFSLDGVHLTPRGNALAANEFIKAINARYGTKIPVLNPGQYRGVVFP